MFVTWRLHGSLPAAVTLDRAIRSGREFVRLDKRLDGAATGPTWLKDPRIAGTVASALHFAENELRLYELHGWVIMSNHVHVVVTPKAPLWRITKAIKGFTARQANQHLNRTGQPFWQHESFDHWVRNRQELERVVRYVEANPVNAMLVNNPAEWPWSSAGRKTVDPLGRLDKTGVISHEPLTRR